MAIFKSKVGQEPPEAADSSEQYGHGSEMPPLTMAPDSLNPPNPATSTTVAKNDNSSCRKRCCRKPPNCFNQGPTWINPCACFYKTNQESAEAAAKICILINLPPFTFELISLKTHGHTLSPDFVTGITVYGIFFCMHLLSTIILRYGVKRNSNSYCFQWLVFQALMLCYDGALMAVHYAGYLHELSRVPLPGGKAKMNQTSTKNSNSSLPVTSPTASKNSSSSSSTANESFYDIVGTPEANTHLAAFAAYLFLIFIGIVLFYIIVMFIVSVYTVPEPELQILVLPFRNIPLVPAKLIATSQDGSTSKRKKTKPNVTFDAETVLEALTFEYEDEITMVKGGKGESSNKKGK